jgi:predicted Zn-dependent protease with MMP-like domain
MASKKPARYDDRVPDADAIEAIAMTAFESIPAELRDHVSNVPIRIQDFPDDETLEALGLQNPFELLGLYHGIDLTQKSILDTPSQVDMIFLYRRPLLDYWAENDVTLGELVRHVLIHEIGHHFGLSDEDMDAIEQKT